MTPFVRLILAAAALLGPVTAGAQALGPDAAACQPGAGPAIEATITGLKDRKGDVRLELYPAVAEDFLKGDRELIAQDKVFRRVAVVPTAASLVLCVRVPRPGRYAVVMIHSRDGRARFDYKIDGAGTPSNHRIGFGKPKLGEAVVTVGAGVTAVPIRAQYLGLFGFAPSSAK